MTMGDAGQIIEISHDVGRGYDRDPLWPSGTVLQQHSGLKAAIKKTTGRERDNAVKKDTNPPKPGGSGDAACRLKGREGRRTGRPIGRIRSSARLLLCLSAFGGRDERQRRLQQ